MCIRDSYWPLRASERVRRWRMPVALTGHGGRKGVGVAMGREGGLHGFQPFQEHELRAPYGESRGKLESLVGPSSKLFEGSCSNRKWFGAKFTCAGRLT
eukprot:4362829-Prymnesium_polylepis.1